MRSVFLWIGVLVGSAVLGLGLYGLVIEGQGTASPLSSTQPSAATPEPRPTIYKYKTKVVKDPPKRKVVDVPVAADPAPQGGSNAAPVTAGNQGSGNYDNGAREPESRERDWSDDSDEREDGWESDEAEDRADEAEDRSKDGEGHDD